MLNAMKRLISFWRILCTLRQDELPWMRAMALGSLITMVAALIARPHYDGFADFCAGLAVAFSAILALQLFSAKSVEPRVTPDEKQLRLSR